MERPVQFLRTVTATAIKLVPIIIYPYYTKCFLCIGTGNPPISLEIVGHVENCRIIIENVLEIPKQID